MKRRFLFMLMAALTFVGANAAILKQNNYLEASAAEVEAGKTVEVNILMTNNKDIINWQTELILPEGVTLEKVEAADKWTETIQVDGNKLFSETTTAVGSNNKGVVAKVTLKVAATVAAGEYDIKLHGTIMTASDLASIQQDDDRPAKLTVKPASTKKGDFTGDGVVNAGDIQALLTIIATDPENTAADLTGDNVVNAGDIQALLTIIAQQE